MTRYLRASTAFAAVCLVVALAYGWYQTNTIGGALTALTSVAILAVLEVSLSFDNAVVNATVLQDMDAVWRRRFLTWGMVISVYGMFIMFPLLIVAVAAKIGPVEALRLSLSDPHRYETLISAAHVPIAGFGGAFLLMVGLKFFFDEDKDVHWVSLVEGWFSRFSALPSVEIAVVLLAVLLLSRNLPPETGQQLLVSGILGVVTFVAVDALGVALEQREEGLRAAGLAVKAGLGGFIYLNMLDASFSFDGVIGAFAISNNMVIIALGLSIGAMFVRSMTVMLVEQGALAEFKYLEHGAFWAILALGAMMLMSIEFEIPEYVIGTVGAASIAMSLYSSVRFRRNEQAAVR